MPNYRAMAVAAARRYGINPQVFMRQINQESGFNPGAHSGAGAEGIAQFMPSTAAAHHINPWNPQQALNAAAQMDAENIKRYGGWAPALSAYNSGRPDAYKDPHFAGGQTFNYVKDILGGANQPMPPVKLGGSTGTALNGQSTQQQLVAALGLMSAAAHSAGLQQQNPLLQLAMQRKMMGAAQQQNGPLSSSKPAQAFKASDSAGGFLPKGAKYAPGRADQGRDGQTNPGQAILAPGSGIVVAVKSDPGGFGPDYPVVHFTSGPYAGKDVYIGHTHATVRPGQKFSAGTVLSRTGTSPVGNASVPGWFEIGYAPGGTPGQFGQSTPF